MKKIYLILIIAFTLRMISINQSLWLDEAISATVAKNYAFTYIWHNFILSDTHPPLYYILLKAWTNIFGYSEISLRMPSVLMGTSTILIVYLIGKKLFSKNTGLISALLLATSGLHIYYSQEVRMYAMTTFLVALSVYVYLAQKWVYLAVSLTILAMTDYLPMTLVLVLLSLAFILKDKRSKLLYFLGSLTPSIVFYLYFAKTFLFQSSSTLNYLHNNLWWGSVLGTSSLKDVALVWVKFILGRISIDNNTYYTLVAVLVSSVFGYTLISALKNFKKSVLVWMWLVFPVLFSFLMSLTIPGFSYFRLIFVMPAFYMLIAVGIDISKWQKILLGLIVGLNLVFSLTYLLNTKYHREDWKSLVPFVEGRISPREVVFVSFSEPFTPYLWYAQKEEQIMPFSLSMAQSKAGIYTLDYLMDLTDPERLNYQALENLGFRETSIYNFRGTGQVRYWKKD